MQDENGFGFEHFMITVILNLDVRNMFLISVYYRLKRIGGS